MTLKDKKIIDLWPEQRERRDIIQDEESSGEAPGRAQFQIPRKKGHHTLVVSGTFIF